MSNATEQTILADAAAARGRDAQALAGEVTAPVTECLEFPAFLLRRLTDLEHEAAWSAYCQEHGVIQRARARGLESQISEPSPPSFAEHADLRAEQKRIADAKRIAKMKAGLDKKAAAASGATKQMPLSGREALAKIMGDDNG